MSQESIVQHRRQAANHRFFIRHDPDLTPRPRLVVLFRTVKSKLNLADQRRQTRNNAIHGNEVNLAIPHSTTTHDAARGRCQPHALPSTAKPTIITTVATE